jgi:hypothetical protein
MKLVLKIGLAVALVALVGIAFYRWKFPHGDRTGYLPCVSSALDLYARQHDGWFPDDPTVPVRALTNLVPDYVSPKMLAGLSGDRRTAEYRILNGGSFTGSESSWVYQTGLRIDDPGDIALLWDQIGGLRGNGMRIRSGDHCVAFISGEIRLVSRETWSSFTNSQAKLRSKVLATRGRYSH